MNGGRVAEVLLFFSLRDGVCAINCCVDGEVLQGVLVMLLSVVAACACKSGECIVCVCVTCSYLPSFFACALCRM